MKKQSISTFLPIFNGFYNTIFDSTSQIDNEVYSINQDRLFNCYKKARQYIRQKKNDTFGSIEAYKNPYKAVKPIIYRENY